MSLTRALSRASRNLPILSQKSPLPISIPPPHHHHLLFVSNRLHSLSDSSSKASLLRYLPQAPAVLQRLGFSSSASSQSSEKENDQSTEEHKGTDAELNGSAAQIEETADEKAAEPDDESGSSTGTQSTSEPGKRRRRGSKRMAFSDSDSEGDLDDLSKDDLVKLAIEKEEALKLRQKEIAAMQDKVLRTYAEMENVMDRARREADNSKKFAIQGFAESLLDVADNLGRASSAVKENFAKIDAATDTTGAVPLLKTLLEGVEMTEKQLLEAFKKFGLEKYDPIDEKFDPNRHNAVFQVPDESKAPGTVAVVLKPGYTLHERVIRPAEVGVTHAAEANHGSES
ncbi:GrpE protein homolog 2, mitochondrial-like protein [Drosera capensis]